MLTKHNSKLDDYVARTPEGMAHWAGSGPDGKTCATCRYFGQVARETATKTIMSKDRCKLYTKMMNGKVGPHPLPPSTPSCNKYLEK
jgi:hypothetical protein